MPSRLYALRPAVRLVVLFDLITVATAAILGRQSPCTSL